MQLEKHHKIIIGGVTSLLIIVVIANSIFMYWVYTKGNLNYNELNQRIESLKSDTQIKLNDLSNNLIETKNSLESLGVQVGTIDEQITKLKASVSSDFSGIIEKAVKSVVTIKTDVAEGSGFIIANGGYVVTNEHVMEGAKAAIIITYDGKTHTVYGLGKNDVMDISLLKIDDNNYPPLKLGNSDDVKQGEDVIAIGSPYGLEFSVSEGIVSAIHRTGQNGLDAYIQTSASLNPGNSGGPLINKDGKVIGINNFKLSEGESLGFALESNYIKEVVNDIYNQLNGENLI